MNAPMTLTSIDGTPPVDGHLVESHLLVQDAGVVDEHPQRAELVGAVEHRRNGRLVGHVGPDGDRMSLRVRRTPSTVASAARSSDVQLTTTS